MTSERVKSVLPRGPELMRAYAITLVLAVGCSTREPANEQQGGVQMPPTEVTVVTLTSEKIALMTELSGRTTVALESEVRPQITGIV